MSSANLAQVFHSACNVSDSIPDWYLDAGASTHMTNQTSVLDSSELHTGSDSVIIGNGSSLNISHISSSKLCGDVNFLDVLVVPHIMKNILSISKLTADYPVDVVFSEKFLAIQNRVTKKILAQGRCYKGLYLLDWGVPTLVATIRNKDLKASFDL